MFIPLKVTTDYSMLQSMITIPKLILFLKKYSILACGICDSNLFGVMEFYDTLEKENIKPLIGLECKIEDTLAYVYARDDMGYRFLLKIHTIIEKEKRSLSLLELETMESHWNIILPYLSLKKFSLWQEKFQHLYIGYTTEYEKNNANILTENLVFCPDFKAFTKKETEYLDLLKAINTNESYLLMEHVSHEKNSLEYYFQEQFEDKTDEFIQSCNVVIKKNGNYIPKYLENEDSNLFLRKLAYKGLVKRRDGKVSHQDKERLNYELSVIAKMGFSDYFLIVYDYVKFAKTNGILVGAGRGSAVGSLVSYSIGITDVDPLKYHLLFERFLNPERVTMPDIDIDFEEERRGEVISYVKKRYGEAKVASIMTFGTLKTKLVVRSVGKCYEINPEVIDSFVSLLDEKKTLKENLQEKNVEYYVKNNADIKKVVSASLKIEGFKKHISTHAAGVVISSVLLDDVIPIHYNGEELQTGVTMNYLEELGLLKMDFLSLANLTIIKNVCNLIKENTQKELNLYQIDLNDQNVLNKFSNADTVGIFQFESEGMKSFLRKLKPTKFTDLVLAIALYRPGPMENIETFLRRKEGKEKVEYLLPELKPILEETYGIIVYQEQIMQILVTVGGFSFAEADTIRRAMSKKKKEIIENSHTKFLKGALKKGYHSQVVENIFELILKFANYGFNKSHSVAYAYIGYQMAYLKCYYKVFYIANLLNMNISSAPKTIEYIALAKKSGIEVLPPSINESEETYKIENSSLRLPFSVIKSIGSEASKTIVLMRKKQKYQDFFDFVARTYGKSVSRKTIESLIDASCFDEFTTNHNALKKSIEGALDYAVLASDLEENYLTKPTLIKCEEEKLEEKRASEFKSFGFYLSNHPASKYIEPNIMKLEQIKKYYNKHVILVVLLEKVKEITTKKGESMAFLTASDETDTGNFVVFSSIMKQMDSIHIGDLVYIEGRIARRLDEYQINVNKIEKVEGKS